MALSKEVYRQFAARQHRILAFYLAVQAWRNGKVGVALRKDVLKKYLGITDLKSERIRWLTDDTADWFSVLIADDFVVLSLRWNADSDLDEVAEYLTWSTPLVEERCVQELSSYLVGCGAAEVKRPSAPRTAKKKAAANKRSETRP